MSDNTTAINPEPVSASPAKTQAIPLVLDDVAPLLEVIRGNVVYGTGSVPEPLKGLGYVYSDKECDGAFLRLIPEGKAGEQAVKDAATALKTGAVLQSPMALESAVLKAYGLYLLEVNNKKFIYRKN